MLRNLKANSFNRLKKQTLQTVKSETVQRFLQTLFQFDSAALSDIFDFNKPDASKHFFSVHFYQAFHDYTITVE